MSCCSENRTEESIIMNGQDEALAALRRKLTSPDRFAAIPSALDNLTEAIRDLDKALAGLIEKIEPALGPDYSDTADEADAYPKSEESTVASRIRYEERRVRDLFHTIHALSDRVEL